VFFPPLHSLDGSFQGLIVNSNANCISGNVGVPAALAVSSFDSRVGATAPPGFMSRELEKVATFSAVQELHRLFSDVLAVIRMDKKKARP
jgi:hypothetical protein